MSWASISHSSALLLGQFLDELRGDVAGHDDDGVLEIDRAALAVGQPAVVQHLEQDVEDVAVGLLDLVEQDDAVGPAADGLGRAGRPPRSRRSPAGRRSAGPPSAAP